MRGARDGRDRMIVDQRTMGEIQLMINKIKTKSKSGMVLFLAFLGGGSYLSTHAKSMNRLPGNSFEMFFTRFRPIVL